MCIRQVAFQQFMQTAKTDWDKLHMIKSIHINRTYHRVRTKCTKMITFAHSDRNTDIHTYTVIHRSNDNYDNIITTITTSTTALVVMGGFV